MSSFSSIEGLLKNIEKNVEDTLRKDISKYAVKTMKDKKKELVYSRPQSEYYERTYEFLNSTVSMYEDNKSSSRKKVLSVFTETNDTFMPSGHSSWVNDKKQNKKIPLWLEYGNFSSLHSYDGAFYFHYSLIEIEDNLKKEFIKGLAKRGIKAY